MHSVGRGHDRKHHLNPHHNPGRKRVPLAAVIRCSCLHARMHTRRLTTCAPITLSSLMHTRHHTLKHPNAQCAGKNAASVHRRQPVRALASGAGSSAPIARINAHAIASTGRAVPRWSRPTAIFNRVTTARLPHPSPNLRWDAVFFGEPGCAVYDSTRRSKLWTRTFVSPGCQNNWLASTATRWFL